MSRKVIILIVVFVAIASLVCVAGGALAPDKVALPSTITAESPCPAVGCVSGECHATDNVPDPDGIHEMQCPEAGCAATECHAWDTLTTRYYQPSDNSLNLWILAPVALVIGLVVLVRKL
ncbi:MAG: hypothetical protein RR477_08015 [Raoultibacter sp.]